MGNESCSCIDFLIYRQTFSHGDRNVARPFRTSLAESQNNPKSVIFAILTPASTVSHSAIHSTSLSDSVRELAVLSPEGRILNRSLSDGEYLAELRETSGSSQGAAEMIQTITITIYCIQC